MIYLIIPVRNIEQNRHSQCHETFGYVNMFNRGVGQVQADLKENRNPPAEFDINLITAFKMEVKLVSQKALYHKATANV